MIKKIDRIPVNTILVFTNHFEEKLKGFSTRPRRKYELDKNDIRIILATGKIDKVFRNRNYKEDTGQWRVSGNTVVGSSAWAIVIQPIEEFNEVGKPNGEFKAIKLLTMYEHRVKTPVRLDQLNTPEGIRFAEVGRSPSRSK
jgi:hypothetical protein